MGAHTLGNSATAYDRDFYAWAMHQAAMLRGGRLSDIDRDRLAGEIEALGRSVKRDLVSRCAVLLRHLLKWSVQPERQGTGWRLTIVEQREQIRAHLAENPSLEAYQAEAAAAAYKTALIRAERETGLLQDMFPWASPYTIEQMLDDAFWPEPY